MISSENSNKLVGFKRFKSGLNKQRLILLAGAIFIFASGYGLGSGRLYSAATGSGFKSVSQNNPENLDYSSVEQVYDSLRVNYDGNLDTQALLDGLKEGLAKASGDPYTEFLNIDKAQDFDEELSGSFTGIGAQLIERDNLVLVEVPLAGYPAEKAGLKAKDAIIEIDGKSAQNMSLSEAVKLIRGEADTKVKLKVIRDSKEQLDFEITRAKISIPSVESEILEGNIGYLKVSRFGTDTTKLAREAAEKFKSANVGGVILDVRNNPGGLLDSAVSLSSIWLEKDKTVLEEKRGGKTIKTYKASGKPILNGIPTIVLINEGSASASEITAGALKDNGVAELVGAKTFGKGSVQQLVEFGNTSVLKVTIARWYTPNGKNIDKEGIEADHKVERKDEDFKNNRDPQKDKAIELLK